VIRGSPSLDAEAPDAQFDPGAGGTVDVSLTNEGTVDPDNETHPPEAERRVTEARSVEVELSNPSGAPLSIQTGRQTAGTIERGEDAGPISFQIEVDENAEPGTYGLDVGLFYQDADPIRYSRDETGELQFNETVSDASVQREITVEIEETPDFTVAALDHDVQIDESGDLSVTLSNTGEADVSDVTVTANAPDQDISFGAGASTSERFVGNWDAGDQIDLTYRTQTSEAAVSESYPVEFDVDFTDSSGETGSQTLESSITPKGQQQYTIENVAHDISIGDDDVLAVTIRNDGPQDVQNASVGIDANDGAITFEGGSPSTETFVGDWDAGETRTLRVRTAVAEGAVQREYALQATVAARNANDNALNPRTREFGFEPLPGQSYTVANVSHDVVIGDDGVLELTLSNDGPNALRNATVSLNTNDPALTFGETESGATTTTTFVGPWPAGENRTVSVRLAASSDAIQRSYTMEATVSGLDRNGSALSAQSREFGLEPLPAQRYVVENVSHTVPVDDNGVLEVTVRNRGPLTVTDASVTVTANDQAIAFGSGGTGDAVQVDDVAFETGGGGAPTSEAFVGEWPAGETRTVRYPMGVSENGLLRNYTVDLAVDARNQDDQPLNTRQRQFGFRPLAEQTFAIERTNSSLRVGEDGTLLGRITNTADRTAENVVVLYNSDLSNIFPRAQQYAIGDLGPGESAQFRFRIGVSEEGEPGPRLFQFQPRYRNEEGESRLGDSQDVVTPIERQRDAFDFETNASLAAGNSDTLEMRVENTLDERVENVRIKLFPDAPLSSSRDETFVEELGPGESTTVVFEVSADGGATPATYPLQLDVRYDDARGDRQLSGTYQQAIRVTESEDGGFPLLFVGLFAVALLGVGIVLRGRLLAALGGLIDRFQN